MRVHHVGDLDVVGVMPLPRQKARVFEAADAFLCDQRHEKKCTFRMGKTILRKNISRADVADALRQLDGPVAITAYAIAQDGGSDLHKLIQEKIRPWQRVKPDIALTLATTK